MSQERNPAARLSRSIERLHRKMHGIGEELVIRLGCAPAALILLIFSTTGNAQLPFAEDFATTVYRDSVQTTADWNTSVQQLLLPVAPTLTGVTFDSSTIVEVIPGKWNTRSLALADLDGDGDLDLIDGIYGRSTVRLNVGGGVFGGRVYAAPDGANTVSIAIGDIDRDGDIDFVEGNSRSRIRLYLNDGTGRSFDVQNVSAFNTVTNGIALVDIDGDGLLDVVAANLEFKHNRLYTNTGDPLFPFGAKGLRGQPIGGMFESSRDVIAGDLDNDGDIDLVFMNEDTENPNDSNLPQRNRVFLNLLAQGIKNSFLNYVIDIDGADDVGLSVRGTLGDMNGDGYLDLIVANYREGQASKIYFNDATGSTNMNPFTTPAVDFTGGASPSDPVFASSVQVADVDNDGDLDIFLTSESVDFRNRIYFNDGSGAITSFVDVGPAGQSPLILQDPNHIAAASMAGAVGDIDDDGDIDWVIGNRGILGPFNPMENIVFRNRGTEGGTLAQQLRAHATSLQIDNSGTDSVKLSPPPFSNMVGPEFHNQVDYWISGDGGLRWSPIMADGRPVNIAPGTDVRWRAELASKSPATATGLALLQLDISKNESGPMLGSPIGAAEVTEDDSVSGLPIISDFSDADGDTIYHSVVGLAQGTGLSIDPLSGVITGTPTNEDALASPSTIIVYATDGALSATDTFTLVVINTNDPPMLTSVPPAGDAVEDVLYTYSVTASDPDPGETALLSFSTTAKPAWLTLTDNGDGTAELAGTPANGDVDGDNTVTLLVTDPSGSSDMQTFSINVINVNDAPGFTSMPPASGAAQGVNYRYDVTAADPDTGETSMLRHTATVLPSWLALVDNGDGTAVLTGTPAAADVFADNSVTLAVTDPGGLSASQSFVVNVVSANRPPTFVTSPISKVTETMDYAYSIRAVDPDFDEIAITATTMPSWLTLTNHGNGFASLRGTPSGLDVGNHTVVLVAQVISPVAGPTASQSFIVTVTAAANGPIITLYGDSQINIFEGSNYNDPGATAHDLQDGDLTDRIVAIGSVETNTPGYYPIKYKVSDSAGNMAEAQRIVRIVNLPPPTGGVGAADTASLMVLVALCLALRRRRRHQERQQQDIGGARH